MVAEPATNAMHGYVYRCPECDFHMGFTGKSEDDPTKYKRPAEHRDLVSKFSDGFCEMCYLKLHELPPRESLCAHHVDPYAKGGEPTRENIWILCTACHRMVEFQRRYRGMAIASIRDERS